jgi:hypothetical protein
MAALMESLPSACILLAKIRKKERKKTREVWAEDICGVVLSSLGAYGSMDVDGFKSCLLKAPSMEHGPP